MVALSCNSFPIVQYSDGAGSYSALRTVRIHSGVGVISSATCGPGDKVDPGPAKDLVQYANFCVDDHGETLGSKRAILGEVITLMFQHGTDPRLWSNNADMLQLVSNTLKQKHSFSEVDFKLTGEVSKKYRAY